MLICLCYNINMPRIYSHISSKDNRFLNKEIKDFFIYWIGNDELVKSKRVLLLVRFINVKYRFDNYKLQIESMLCSDEKKECLVNKLNRITPEYRQLCNKFGRCMFIKVMLFNILVDKYGLKKLRKVVDFGYWLYVEKYNENN